MNIVELNWVWPMRKRTSPFYIVSRMHCIQKLSKYVSIDSTPLAQLCLGNGTLSLYIKSLFMIFCFLFCFQSKMVQELFPLMISYWL